MIIASSLVQQQHSHMEESVANLADCTPYGELIIRTHVGFESQEG